MGQTDTARCDEDSLACASFVTKATLYRRLQTGIAITRVSCLVLVMSVVFVVLDVLKNLTERFVRHVSEEFAPVGHLAE